MQGFIEAVRINDLGDILTWLSVSAVLVAIFLATRNLLKQDKTLGTISKAFLLVIGIIFLLAALPVIFVLDFALNFKSDSPSVIPMIVGFIIFITGVFFIFSARKSKRSR